MRDEALKLARELDDEFDKTDSVIHASSADMIRKLVAELDEVKRTMKHLNVSMQILKEHGYTGYWVNV
jgi:predicted translin family RNA/ssDNA-binding protein